MRRNRALFGAAGVHYVCAELSRRECVALPTVRNTAGIDILASSTDGRRQVAIQVKTSSNGRVWRLSESAERLSQPGLFYVLVGLRDSEPPSFHIIPSAVVAGWVRADHARFLATPDRHGQPHKDSSVRVFRNPESKYLNRWDLLGLDPEVK